MAASGAAPCKSAGSCSVLYGAPDYLKVRNAIVAILEPRARAAVAVGYFFRALESGDGVEFEAWAAKSYEARVSAAPMPAATYHIGHQADRRA